MTKLIYWLLFLVLLCPSGAFSQAADSETEDSAHIDWTDNFEEAQAKALAEDKLILLDFYSDT
jgi:hypothetical protein